MPVEAATGFPFGIAGMCLCLLVMASAGGFAWYAALVGQQITYVTLADGRRQERQIPLVFRLLLPWTPNLIPFIRRPFFKNRRERIDSNLIAAGFKGVINGTELIAIQFLMPLVFLLPWCAFVLAALAVAPGEFLPKLRPVLLVFGPLWMFFYPSLWLRHALYTRHTAIRRALPFMLDLLTLAVEAGMDFMTSLQRNVERRKVDALGEELIQVIREIQVGKTRREALRDLGRRVGLADLRAVVNALVQADELGVSIGSILRIQADQMRLRRFERAEKLANEAPVKMLFPLLLFIFPSVFLVLLGPIVYRIIQQGI